MDMVGAVRRMWRDQTALALAIAVGAATASAADPLPKWTPGTLDIHQINTGLGNAALVMLPDGTTLLIDAGDRVNVPPRATPPRPDASRPAGAWIARYARATGATAIDYALLTHFHDDHMDALPDVAEGIPIRTLLDRGWPDYAFPSADHAEFKRPGFVRYREYVKSGRMRVERLMPGRSDQIVPRVDPKAYPQLEVRNVAANGEIWTGTGTETRSRFPPLATLAREDWPTENMCSLGIRLRYGRFDYYSGGDIPGLPRPGYPEWQDIETPVAQAVGAVDVAVLNHHGNRDSTNPFFVSTLRPRLWIIPVWSSDHPGYDVLDRMYSARLYPDSRDVFATNMLDANKIVIGPLLDRLLSSQGHIVIRVSKGGDSYQVLILDDTAESYTVKATHGPYEAR